MVFVVIAFAATLVVAINLVLAAALSNYTLENKSYLEGRAYQQAPALDADLLASGTFQSQFERLLADHVPKRNGIMICNASIQRTSIAIANMPFSYPAYPTFLGSDRIVYPSANAVIEAPLDKRNYTTQTLAEGASAWATFAGEYPNLRFFFAIPDRAMSSSASPAHELVSQPADYDYFLSNVFEGFPDNCDVANLAQKDSATYFDYFFKTDHHWQTAGAYSAYLEIANLMGFEPVFVRGFPVVYAGPYFGSSDRGGLDVEYSDSVMGIDYDPSDFQVVVNGRSIDKSSLSKVFAEDDTRYHKQTRFENVYAAYFHGDYALLEYHNDNIEDGTLLVIGDSYTNNIDFLFAESYRDVYVVDLRHYEDAPSSIIDEYGVDDVLVLMGANNLVSPGVLARLK